MATKNKCPYCGSTDVEPDGFGMICFNCDGYIEPEIHDGFYSPGECIDPFWE